MLRIGYNETQKRDIIKQYCNDNNIEKVYIFSPEKFSMLIEQNSENITYAQIIKYKYYYRLIKDIGVNDLIVINECLRTQNRSDLTYNCLRQYLLQTKHQIVFQYLPQIDTFDDFMILLDFDTRTKFKMQSFDSAMLEGIDIDVNCVDIGFNAIDVVTSDKIKAQYEKKKRQMFDNIGMKDPHTIPRNLYLIGGKSKLEKVQSDKLYVGRNKRFKLDNIATFKDAPKEKRTIFEFEHNFINVSDYMYQSQSPNLDVLKTDLKVDDWYFERYTDWSKRIKDGYTNLQ